MKLTSEQLLSIAQYIWPSDRRMWSVDAELPKLARFAECVIADVMPQWTKCSEAMPEKDGDYLMYDGDQSGVRPYHGYYLARDGRFRYPNGFFSSPEQWLAMPRPRPSDEEQENPESKWRFLAP